MPSVSDAELQSDDEFSSAFQWEAGRGPVGQKSDEELQLLSASHDGHPSRRSFKPSKLEHRIAMPPVSDEEKKQGSISTREGEGEGAATPQFMPRLQVLHFHVPEQAFRDHANCCDNLGLEFLSSLQEISVGINMSLASYEQVEEAETVLWSAGSPSPSQPSYTSYRTEMIKMPLPGLLQKRGRRA
jgi:hypothetical protein